MAELKYKRVLLKLSGEALAGEKQIGIDPHTVSKICAEIADVVDMGLEVALVIGGGNIFRGLSASAEGMDRSSADYMGMLATVLNALAVQDALEKTGHPTRVLSAIAMQEVCEPYVRLRTGRASTGLVDNIKVDYYGTPTPISQLASVAIPDSRTITIQPWDRGAFASVEKAILKSDLGLTPVNDGKIIRISIPPLTEDRRKELGKLARKSGEEAKVAVRNVRRDANDQLKKLEKDKAISEDELKKATDDVQKLTDKYVAKVDEKCAAKEKEIMDL